MKFGRELKLSEKFEVDKRWEVENQEKNDSNLWVLLKAPTV